MLVDYLNQQLRQREAQSLRRRRAIAGSACGSHQQLGDTPDAMRDMLTFCSNDYLGLANHPALIEALHLGAQRFGAGSGSSHLINGHSLAHMALEADLAAFMAPFVPNAEALYFSTGYMANLAVLTAFGTSDATVFADKLNHASLIDGALLAKASRERYPHNNLGVLADKLARCPTPLKLIVTDAVFSMDGDLCDLPGLLALAERFDAWIVLDDAHGFGVLGEQGQGTIAHFGLSSERFIYMGTLGKAAGLSGAFVAAHPTLIDWLVQTARSYVYSTASSPAIAHALRTSLSLIRGEVGAQRRAALLATIASVRRRLLALIADHPSLGWRLADSASAIQPLVVGANDTALRLSSALDRQGLRIPAIRPPTVPVGTARLRITLSSAHGPADVDRLVDGLARAAGEWTAHGDAGAEAGP